ncbi:ubiquitin-like domain-containing protein [Streptomyces sp. MUM 178J]|nr:ubiquitin-like domain-containing protein [Streptomyces sp. MUM 178J]WRQ79826.1 ubiquitin-like domain-containing protein [Streptomyces sp. MUM 178J]
MSYSQGSHRASPVAGVPGAQPPPDAYTAYDLDLYDAVTATATAVAPLPVPLSPPPPAAGGRAAARHAARRREQSGGAGGGSTGIRCRNRLVPLVPQALVVAFLAGGAAAFVASDKAVRLSVDGTPRTLHTYADDVAELLADEGVVTGAHDLVSPAVGEPLTDGDEVVVRYGRPLTLTLDGRRRRVWTTARTVDGALRQLGVRAEGAYLSASRSAPISREGMTLLVRTERAVTFMADGRERTVRTNAATVRGALAAAGIVLRGEDTASAPLDSFPRDGQTITVMRITGSRQVREEAIPFQTVETLDDTLFAGTEAVVRQGRPGARRVTYALRTVNGVLQKPRKLSDEVVRAPVAQLVRVGTRPRPTSIADVDGLNWQALAECESGGRPGAVDSSGTYGGLYQLDRQTWRALGGEGVAQDASSEEQTRRAKKLYVQRGAAPWPHCGRRLYR